MTQFRQTFTHRLMQGDMRVDTVEGVRFRPHHKAVDPIEPNAGLDENDTLLVVKDCDQCFTRLPRQAVLNGMQVVCTKNHRTTTQKAKAA